MNSGIRFLGAAFVVCIAASCADRTAGNTMETENSIGISVDSLLPEHYPTTNWTTVGVLRLDAANFDFARSTRDARDLAVVQLDETPMPFRVVFWDSVAALGRIQVRLDSALVRKRGRFLMRWAEPRANRVDSAQVWKGLPASQVTALTSFLVDDFESGTITSNLPTGNFWYGVTKVESTSVTTPRVVTDSTEGTGKVMRVLYAADSAKFRYVVVGLDFVHPRILRSMDSLVLRVRGSGKLTIAFDNLWRGSGAKAWYMTPLTPTWKRVVLRPRDFLPVGDIPENVGWAGVRDSVTNLTFLLAGGTRFEVDDIRFHGIDVEDFR